MGSRNYNNTVNAYEAPYDGMEANHKKLIIIEKDTRENVLSIPIMQLKEFSRDIEFKQMHIFSNCKSLVFTNYLDQNEMNWLQICSNCDEHSQPEEHAICKHRMTVNFQFFEKQQQEFINRALSNCCTSLEPILLNEELLLHWQFITDKIECTMSSNYIFRKQFLQELFLLAIHFILKQNPKIIEIEGL